MKNKILSLLLILVCVLSLVACKDKDEDKVTISSISIEETTIPAAFAYADLDSNLANIIIKVNKSDGSTSLVHLDKSMIDENDLKALKVSGTYTAKVTYEGKVTTVKLTIANNFYNVLVLYPDGTPVAGSVKVQWCQGELCQLPVTINNQGIAEKDLSEGDYYIHLLDVPQGYTYDPNAYTTSVKNKSVVINLLSVTGVNNGNGTKENPYVLTNGASRLNLEANLTDGLKYYSFTANESGTYIFKSIAMDALATNPVTLYLYNLSTDINGSASMVGKTNNNEVNFTYEFEVVAGSTYYFYILNNNGETTYPTTFDIVLIKK